MTRIVRKARPVSDSSEDSFRMNETSELGRDAGDDSISAAVRHRHITLTSSKVVVSRATSPTPPGKSVVKGQLPVSVVCLFE